MNVEALNKEALEGVLEAMVNAKQENRAKAASHVLAQKELFSALVSLTFDVDKPISIKAAWVLEWICTHGNLQLLYPNLNFIQKKNQAYMNSSTKNTLKPSLKWALIGC